MALSGIADRMMQEALPAAKMVELKSAGYVLAIIAFMVSLGVNINTYTNDEGVIIDEGYLPYSCEKETVEDMYCYKLSKVGTTGVNRNCYYDRERGRKYKVCSTGWELIQVGEPPTCPEPVICPEVVEKECPYVQPCKVCKEPVECPKLSGGGGGSSCPACPSCNADGTTECTEIIGFAITEQGRYYCRDCGPDGCDACISNEDIDLSLELHEFD